MGQNLFFQIQKQYTEFRQSEKRVADYLLYHEEEDLSQLRLEQLAVEAGVSQTSVLRFVRSLGFDGFRDFHLALIRSIAGEKEQELGRRFGDYILKPDTAIADVPASVIATAMQRMEEVLKNISAVQLEAVVEAITSGHLIVLYAVENSAGVAQDLLTKLMYLGINASYYTDYYLQCISASNLKKGDVAIGISYTGSSVQTMEVLKIARQKGAKTIALTNFAHAPIAACADLLLTTSSSQFLYGNAIFSRVTQLAVIDMIYMGILASNYSYFTKKLDQDGKLINRMAYQQNV